MPFKLKLKKTRQYNVASKSLFVLSVELLDGGVADCTLSVDSTGQECLNNVCQRQQINQPEFFGLRYINHNQQPRWVQLDRPLKRQLEKHASSQLLYLRVMYYVNSGTALITDEVTRYNYFLQLKNDLIEGRIICDLQQAVVLASYSRQAEYGNHDRERHTVEYLKNLLTFPKQMLDGGQLIDGSTLAETGRLEWLTAAVIQQHMALHNMSQAQAEEGFITTCQQLRGYGQEMFLAKSQHSQREVTIAVSFTGIRVLADNSDTPHLYRWQDITNVINHKRTFSIECQRAAESCMFVLATPEDGKYVWRMCVQQHTFYMEHQRALREAENQASNTKFQERVSASREDICVPTTISSNLSSGLSVPGLSSAHRAHSTSCLELAAHNHPHAGSNRALLPQYRPAPDYETAVQQKYQQQRTEAQIRYQNHSHSQIVNNKPSVYGSHPDIHRIHYPDVTRHTVSVNQPTEDFYGLMRPNYPFQINPNTSSDIQLQYVNVYKPPPPYPSNGLASNSTPDLAVASQAINYHRGYINSHVSGSSPDLVSTRTAMNRQFIGFINPNIVNYTRPNIMPGSHGTFNNLAVIEPNPRIIIDRHHVSDNYQKVCDDRGNVMYSMPMHRVAIPRHLVLPQKINDTQEPIYENVPLPWQSDGKVMIRDRAQSLTTTEEITRLNERNSSHPAINHYGQNPNLNVPNYMPMKADSDSHYVNAQIIKGVRESSVPKDLNISNRDLNISNRDLNISNRSINKDEFENVALSIDRLSIKTDEKDDETPYQSLSTHKINNNTINKSSDHVTSISIGEPISRQSASNHNINMSNSTDSAFSNSIINSTYSTSVDMDSSNSKNSVTSVSSKEKKRRRWGVFMGRATKTTDVKSATLGRDKAKNTIQPSNKHRWSTGLPKFQPLPPSITKETLCQLLERRMSDDQLSFAFEQIPKGRETGGEVKIALLPQHAALNGYSTDNIPYDDNRVKLAPTPDNPYGYINASHITMTVGSRQRFYIVFCAGAPEGGASGVWGAAWQSGARVLGALSCDGASRGDTHTHTQQTHCGEEISLSTLSVSKSPWGATSRLQLRRGRQTRQLWQVEFHWPDNKHTPPLNNFLCFVSELRSLCVASSAECGTAPLLLRCAAPAATSRAGLALAADLLMHLVDHNQEIDIPRTISMLHQQRANLIENVHQYKFLHQVLLHYLKQSRLI